MRRSAKATRCYFSLRSPYSWLAMRRLRDAGLGIGSELEYLPYFEPSAEIAIHLGQAGGGFLYAPMCREKHLYILADVKRTLLERGEAFRWPVDRDPDWSVPHRAFIACDTPQLQRDFAFAAMEARWRRGESIWRWDEVEPLLAAVGTPAAAARICDDARSDRVARLAAAALHRAYSDGVFGVPFLIAGREKFWGNDRVEPFLTSLREVEAA